MEIRVLVQSKDVGSRKFPSTSRLTTFLLPWQDARWWEAVEKLQLVTGSIKYAQNPTNVFSPPKTPPPFWIIDWTSSSYFVPFFIPKKIVSWFIIIFLYPHPLHECQKSSLVGFFIRVPSVLFVCPSPIVMIWSTSIVWAMRGGCF